MDGPVALTPLGERFEQIDRILHEHALLFRSAPFKTLEPDWRHTHPELYDWLCGLDTHQAQRLEHDPQALCAALARFVPAVSALEQLCRLPEQPALHTFPQDFDWSMTGRKWSQVRSFAAAATRSGLPLLDWCSGKGHLARALSFAWSRPAICLEHDAALCASGEQHARRELLPLLFDRTDVLDTAVEHYFEHPYQAVALHACGRLHVRLLRLSVRHALPALSLAPCCYHLADADTDLVLSARARAARYTPTLDDARLAVQETVVARNRIRRLRALEQSRRLGFDLLQRELSGNDRYRPVPPMPTEVVRGDFARFCRWAAERIDLELPSGLDPRRFEEAGQARYAQVTRLALLRHGFRRAIEHWLVLDRVLLLIEHGYDCRLSQFCVREHSPRNLLIEARHHRHAGDVPRPAVD
ncbi:MAG: methyltransferase [Gammaproteobacteria bacterium]|nr:methyltransferase [Gammaproteobacteria bacterium]